MFYPEDSSTSRQLINRNCAPIPYIILDIVSLDVKYHSIADLERDLDGTICLWLELLASLTCFLIKQ